MNQIDKIMKCIPQPNKKGIDSINSPYAKSILDQLVTRYYFFPDMMYPTFKCMKETVTYVPLHTLSSVKEIHVEFLTVCFAWLSQLNN